MWLTRRACYGLIAAKHLAEHAGEGSFSSNDPAEFYGLPHEALAKILQRLATAGVLMSHHGIKGGYTLARDPRYISVLDVIEASEGPRRGGIHGEHCRHLAGYHQLGMVSQVVEGIQRELTIEAIEGKTSRRTTAVVGYPSCPSEYPCRAPSTSRIPAQSIPVVATIRPCDMPCRCEPHSLSVKQLRVT